MGPELARHSEKFYYFFEIANAGSLQSAARKIGTAAANLSQSIKVLEGAVGTPLFNRSKNGVTLTEAGEQLFLFCRKYFREIDELQRAMEHPDQAALKRIRIGTFQSIALYFWPLLMNSIKPEDGLSLSITTDRSRVIIELLLKKIIDVALTVETVNHEKIIKHELYKDEYAFYAPKSWQKTTLTKEEVRSLVVLYIPDALDENARSLRQYLHSWNLIFHDEFELDSFEVVCEFVKSGYGVGILPTQVAKSFKESLVLVSIEGLEQLTFGPHRFYLSYRDDLDLPQSAIKKLLKNAKSAAIQLNS